MQSEITRHAKAQEQVNWSQVKKVIRNKSTEIQILERDFDITVISVFKEIDNMVEIFSKEQESIKKNQLEILELRNTEAVK